MDLREVRVRPTYGEAERCRWDDLMRLHHYLPFHGVFGKGLRHVAEVGSHWVALVGWQAGAFKLGARDRWIGWNATQKHARLHLIANNVRFVLLLSDRVPNLASRVLGLSLQRLSSDMQAAHGYPVFLAETFVDPSRFHGTCYRASNWRYLGQTSGFSRQSGGMPRWQYHGQPKDIFIFELMKQAKEELCREEIPAEWTDKNYEAPMPAKELLNLREAFETIPDYRKSQGRRYSLVTVLTLAVAARLAGYRGITALAQFAQLLSQEQLEAVGTFYSPTRKCFTAPAIGTFHAIFKNLPPEAIEEALHQWSGRQTALGSPIAMDGKAIRGASKRTKGGNRMTVAAMEQKTGVVLGQVSTDQKSNEIPAVRKLICKINVKGRIITVDAIHVQHETMGCILDNGGEYVVTSVKRNQKKIREDLESLDYDAAPSWTTLDEGHGRIEERTCSVVDISGPEWEGTAPLYGRKQAVRIVRKVTKKGEDPTDDTSYCLTSLGTEQAGPKQLLALVRGHWSIENRLHYVRDFTYDEDRCRGAVGYIPENLSCLSNLAIAIVRLQGEFSYLPEALRYFAARPQEALELTQKRFD